MSTVVEPTAEHEPTGAVKETRLWHAQAHMPTVKKHEVLITRGEGAYVWDSYGRRLLDAPAALWFCNVGHGRAEIADAAARQMRTLAAYSSFQQYATEPAVQLAERLADMVPVRNAKVFFTSGGGDAIDTAAKLARRYWSALGRPEKRMLVTRTGSYHGLHGYGTSLVGIDVHREGIDPLVPETVRVPTNDSDALDRLVSEKRDTIAAFFCEPVVGSGGIIHPAPGYLEEAQRICRENDVIFVVDEVIAGFGRTGAMFASDRWGLEPDIMIAAKGLTSGYLPLGAAIVGERIWSPFWEDGSDLVFRHGLTYSGHATACAVGLANLDILEREQLVDRVRSLEPVLAAAVGPLADHPLVTDVRSGIGLLAGIQVRDAGTAERVCASCFRRGVFMRTITNATLHVSPPFVLDEDDIALLAGAIAESLDEVAAG